MAYYFAYGSNVFAKQMKERCPDSSFYSVAFLPDHKIVFPRSSRARKCGVVSIQLQSGGAVWGAVFLLSEEDEKNWIAVRVFLSRIKKRV